MSLSLSDALPVECVGSDSQPAVCVASDGYPATPIPIDGLALWIKASAITGLADADPVAAWSDLSGNGRHLTQSTASSRPTYRAGQINGQDVVRFDGTNDVLSVSSVGLNMTAATIFAVVKPIAQGTTSYRALLGRWNSAEPASSRSFDFGIYEDNRTRLTVRDGTISLDTGAVAKAGDHGNGVASVYSFDFSRTAIRLWINGTSRSSVSGNLAVGTDNEQPFVLGDRATSGIQSPRAMDVAELVIYDRVVTADERGGVEDYLAAKYALTVA